MSSNEALARHRAGDRPAAETLYRAALAENAADWQALHGLGVLCSETDRRDEAIALLERAMSVKPGAIKVACNLAAVYAAAGRLAEAERLYRTVLAQSPGTVEAQYNVANVLRDQQRSAEALAAYEATIALDPRHAAAARQQVELLVKLERWAEAEAACDRAITLDPSSARLCFHRGGLRQKRGEQPGAIEDYARALALKPDHVAAAVNLGAALQAAGREDEAQAAHRRALTLDPDALAPMRNLAMLLERRGKRAEALELRRREAALAPGAAESQNALGNLLSELGRYEEACQAFERALALRPDSPAVLSNLAFSLCALDRFEPARAIAERAIELDPQHANAYCALGHIWSAQADNDRAIETWRSGLQAVPEDPGLHANLALGLLKRGDFEAGWREYEWRALADNLAADAAQVQAPRWQGEPLAGKTLLLLREQGLGDMLQFVRYAEPLAADGARLLIDCPRPLRRLFATVPGVARVVDARTPGEPVDYEIRLMSLPHRCGTGLAGVSAEKPYFAADPVLAGRWQARLARHPRPRIGLAWQGNPNFKGDRKRSVPLARLAPLLAFEATCVSLQKDHGRDQIARLETDGRLVDWTPELEDFADTAALVSGLDLVISVDSAIGHLAGGLGKPVWLMLGQVADFRWLLDRSDSPWYPLHRLYRQPRPGDWDSVVAAMAADLSAGIRSGAMPGQRG